MYSRKIVDANLDAFASREGWRPIPHTFDQVQEFKQYVDSITRADTNSRSTAITLIKELTKKRADELRRWIENEQVLCALDFDYWQTRYAYVCSEKGDIFKFSPRQGQRVFESVVAEFDELQVAIELFVLKARQLGISTVTALYFLHRLLFVPHTQAVMASVQAEKSELIGRILSVCLDYLPWWLTPIKTTDKSKALGFNNGSIMSVQSGMQATGIAQGWTPTCVHLCLGRDSKIPVRGGRVKAIQEVGFCDDVITSSGELKRVKRMVKSERSDTVGCALHLWGNYDALVVTRDHPILTPEGFVPAEMVDKHDYVVNPVREIRHTTKEIELIHHRHRKTKRFSPAKRTVLLNLSWGYLCGLYLAEGCAHRNVRLPRDHWDSVDFTVHKDELEYCTAWLKSGVEGIAKVHSKKSKTSNAAHLLVYNASITRWLVENFGAGAENKTIPDWCFNAGTEFLMGLLRGYAEGDGHISPTKRQLTMCSTSLALCLQVRDLIASLGYGWCCLYHQDAGFRYGRNCREQWTLALNGEYALALRKAMAWNTVDDREYVMALGSPQISSKPKHWRYSDDGKSILIEVFENTSRECGDWYDLEIDAPEHDFRTIHCIVKNSEVGDIPNPKKTIEEGLFRATHSSRKLFMVLEGTGNGNTGWQADTWRALKEDWPKGKARFCPVFIPWPMSPDIYPEPDWLRKFPIPENWQPHNETRKHVRKCELYIRSTDYLAKIVGRNWRMPEEQQWFWEFNYDAAVKSHTQKVWMSQMPADDKEALVGKNDSVFDQEVIEVLSSERSKKYDVYGIQGETIDEGLDPYPELIDYNKERVPIHWESHRGTRYEWTLVPLKEFDDSQEKELLDKILVFEPPVAGYNYSIGIDTAHGLGEEDEDRTVISITHNVTGENQDEQVCEFSSNRVNSAQAVGFAAGLAAWYGAKAKDSRGCKFCIEQVQGPGDTCQHQLKLMGFTWHHVDTRYDSKHPKESLGHKAGFYTRDWNRPILLDTFAQAVTNNWYKPNSPGLISELKDFERRITASGKTRLEHQSGKHDDRIFAAAMSYFTAHHFDVVAERAQKRYQKPSGRLPEIDYSYSAQAQFSVGDM